MSPEGLSRIFCKKFFRTLTARSEAESAIRYSTGPLSGIFDYGIKIFALKRRENPE